MRNDGVFKTHFRDGAQLHIGRKKFALLAYLDTHSKEKKHKKNMFLLISIKKFNHLGQYLRLNKNETRLLKILKSTQRNLDLCPEIKNH